MAAARFTVTKPEEEEIPITDIREGYGSHDGAHVQHTGKGEYNYLDLIHPDHHPRVTAERRGRGWGGGVGHLVSQLLMPT